MYKSPYHSHGYTNTYSTIPRESLGVFEALFRGPFLNEPFSVVNRDIQKIECFGSGGDGVGDGGGGGGGGYAYSPSVEYNATDHLAPTLLLTADDHGNELYSTVVANGSQILTAYSGKNASGQSGGAGGNEDAAGDGLAYGAAGASFDPESPFTADGGGCAGPDGDASGRTSGGVPAGNGGSDQEPFGLAGLPVGGGGASANPGAAGAIKITYEAFAQDPPPGTPNKPDASGDSFSTAYLAFGRAAGSVEVEIWRNDNGSGYVLDSTASISPVTLSPPNGGGSVVFKIRGKSVMGTLGPFSPESDPVPFF